MAGVKLFLIPLFLFLAGCANMEPYNGCMVAAMNKQDVLAMKSYASPNRETHLLAVEWEHGGGHMALAIKGRNKWFVWDDGDPFSRGGRELFNVPVTKQLPNPITTAEAAFPMQKIGLAWWCDEPNQ